MNRLAFNSIPRRLALFGLLTCSGCVIFDHEFNRVAQEPVQTADPILGSWQGSWSSAKTPYHQLAKVIAVKMTSDSAYKISLALWGFDGIYEEAGIPDVAVKNLPEATQEFTCICPLEGDGTFMELRGEVKGNSMQIKYQTRNGSDDHGTI